MPDNHSTPPLATLEISGARARGWGSCFCLRNGEMAPQKKGVASRIVRSISGESAHPPRFPLPPDRYKVPGGNASWMAAGQWF